MANYAILKENKKDMAYISKKTQDNHYKYRKVAEKICFLFDTENLTSYSFRWRRKVSAKGYLLKTNLPKHILFIPFYNFELSELEENINRIWRKIHPDSYIECSENTDFDGSDPYICFRLKEEYKETKESKRMDKIIFENS